MIKPIHEEIANIGCAKYAGRQRNIMYNAERNINMLWTLSFIGGGHVEKAADPASIFVELP